MMQEAVVVESELGRWAWTVVRKALPERAFEQVTMFYVDISTKRAEAFKRPDNVRTARAEYMESYRHLKEHGNALLILVAETIQTRAAAATMLP